METVSVVAGLLDSAARQHDEQGESDLARRLRVRARTVRKLLDA